jgi:4-amino-4-deoxy-L-arabinose transferase-like glycosyltransferase
MQTMSRTQDADRPVAGSHGVSGIGLRAAGVLLLVLPFLPLRALFGQISRTGWLLDPSEWLLGIFMFGALAWLGALLVPGFARRVRQSLSGLGERPGDRSVVLAGLAILLVLLFVVSTFAFARRPLLVDSIAQLFQARVFASGQLWAPAPPFEAFFAAENMVVDGGRWYSQYPPGHAAALTPGVLAGVPWLIPILMTAATAWLLFGFTRRVYDRRTARLTLLLALLSPFFWFMGASYMNHVSALFFVALFLALFARWEGKGGVAWLAGAGLALGAAFLSRPLTAIAVGMVFAIVALVSVWRARARPLHLLAGLGGVAVCAGLFLVYNALTTGDPLQPGYMKLWGDDHGLGFHSTPYGGAHTPLIGLQSQLVDLALLNSFLFEWGIPALLPLGFFLAAGLANHRWDGRLVLGFLAIPIAYFLYWHRDAFLGPRFLYSTLAFVLPLTSRAFLGLYDRLGDRVLSERHALGRFRAADWLTMVLVLSFGYALLYSSPQRFRVYRLGMEGLKLDLAREAEMAGIEEGLIFVSVSWGNRLLARMHQVGLPAALTERVYRRSDHCQLEEAVRLAEAGVWTAEQLATELERLVQPEGVLVFPMVNDDRTLRLLPNAELTATCVAELRHDEAGYTNYVPHLAANRPDLTGRFVFARDLRDQNAALRGEYLGRPAYRYRPGGFERLE